METYHGHVRTPSDAILLFEACRIGLLPRVQRRLSEKERQQIKSGSVFVWDEREAGMRRWTDGKSWSASRVSGSFLTYREMEGKRGGNTFTQPIQPKRASGKSPEGSATGDSDGEGPDGYRYKPDGLIKQSFSITTSQGQHLHLISYFSRGDPNAQNLQQPTSDAQLRHIRPPKNMYPESTVNETSSVPAVTRGPMPSSPYAPVSHSMGSSSPYSRPGTTNQVYMPPGYPITPGATPPMTYTYYHPGQQIAYPVVYGQHPYMAHHPPPPTHYDSVPQPLRHPHQPPSQPILIAGHPPHYSHPQYPPPPRPAQSSELSQLQAQMNNQQGVHHLPTTSAYLEPGPILPAISGVHSNTARIENKPPSPQQEPKVQDALHVSTAGPPQIKAPSPARTIPSVGALLNGHSTDGTNENKSNPSNSRSGSPSANATLQMPLRDISGDKLATNNSRIADASAIHKLNSVFSNPVAGRN